MTELQLGLRLALAGGWARALLVVVGNVVGVVVLLLATAVPATLPAGLSADDRRFAASLVLFLVLPVISLLASTTRLSAAVRDRRLAALRLLGVTARRTRAIAACEASLLALTGVAAGALTYVLAARPLLQALDDSWRSWFDGRPLAPPPLGWVSALLGVPLLSVVIAMVPVRATTWDALSVRRQGPARRPAWWRLLPLAVGLALLAWAATRAQLPERNPPATLVVAFFAGAALTAVAIPLVVPVAVRLLGDAGSRLARTPATTIAARRLQQEPAGTTRLVAALLVALFVVAGGRCVLVAFETTPQYQRAALAASTGPQLAQLDVPEGSSLNAGVLADIPGVRAVVPGRQVGTECTPEDLRGFPPGADRPSTCGEAFVGTCAQLAFFSHQITGCRDDQAAWLDPGYGEDFSEQVTVTLLSQPTYAADGREIPGPGGPLRLDGLGTISIAPSPDDPNWRPQAQLFVPVTTPGLSTLLAPARTWLVALEGGDAPVRALAAAVPDNVIVYPDDRTDLQTVQGYRYVLYAVAGVVLILGLLALLISGIDRAVERRRHLAALTVLGVPARVVRSSQLLQAAAPLVVGLPLAGGSGLLAGAAYLNLIGARAATPWPAIVALVLGALAAGALVAAATVAGLGGRVQPQDLRQE
ncbi:MAG: ABC transporter permease [Geodermatophilaceae bacterium]|nr:ABC transporter permease [Geodermatophilaceae bacterium]